MNNLSQALQPIKTVNNLADRLSSIGDVIIYLLIGLAIIYIVWNIVNALIKGYDPAAKTVAIGNIGYGILGLAIIVSIWGLVSILTNTFNPSNSVPASSIPSANFINGQQGGASNTLNSDGMPLYDAQSGFGQQNQGQI